MYRRRLLQLGSICLGVSIAGCTTDGPDSADIGVENRTEGPQSVTLTVTRIPGQSTVLSESFEIAVDEIREFDDRIRNGEWYKVEVEVRNGPSDSYIWDVAQGDLRLKVSIESASINFGRIVS